MRDELKNLLVPWQKIINSDLEDLIDDSNEFADLLPAMRYSLLAPGKRIRPVLCCLSAALFSAKVPDFIIKSSLALELLHTYTLIHDDLPCMDDDDLRRGRPTLHKVYPENIALLAGDALLTMSFEILADQSHTFPDRSIRAVKELADYAGAHGVIGGQVLDLTGENKELSFKELKKIHFNKTAKLIIASCRIGAILSGADEKSIEALTTYARAIGLAFQVADDILDEVGDVEKLGKNSGQDLKLDKSTYPKIFGLEKAKQILHELIEDAINALDYFPENTEPLIIIAKYIEERDH